SSKSMSECEWMSMNPGATTRPLASIVFVAFTSSARPTAAMRWPVTATSPANHGLPLPSTILPPRMSRSQGLTSSALPISFPNAAVQAATERNRSRREGDGMCNTQTRLTTEAQRHREDRRTDCFKPSSPSALLCVSVSLWLVQLSPPQALGARLHPSQFVVGAQVQRAAVVAPAAVGRLVVGDDAAEPGA